MKNKIFLIIALSICFINTYAQSPLDQRIDALVKSMTTQEKLDQMRNNRTSFGGTPANVRLGIPGFVMGDSPHGVRLTSDRYGRSATAFPTGVAMAATWDEAVVGKIGEYMGLEFWSYGRQQALGPCLDLARDSRGGRTAESGGEDPYLAGHLAKSFTIGMQKYPIIATLKHFMGESMQVNRLKMDVIASQRWLMDFSGYNFRIPIQEAGAMSVMNSYNKINGEKAAESSILQKTILRERWGFPFYIVSDWASIDEARNAVRAGTDICMGSSNYEADLPALVENGHVTMAQIDSAVKSILKTKILNGMLDYYPAGNESNTQTQEITDLNLLAAQKSVVLLKNEKSGANPILPLQKSGIKIAIIGPNATAENLNCSGSSATNPPYAISVKKGLEDKIGSANITYAKGCDINSTSKTGFAEAKTLAAAADYVIFAGGLDNTQEGEQSFGAHNDRVGGSFALPAIQQELINELAGVNPNLIAVIQSGGVCTFNDCLPNIKGFIYSFYAAQEAGRAIADVVFGDYNPAGRMPLSMPMKDSDFPEWKEDVFRKFEQNKDGGYRWLDEKGTMPRYAFGYGLSYTTFEYSNLQMPTDVVAGQPFSLTVDVKNTGSRAGEEVVQVYISAPSDKVWMPKKELRGFRRIALEPGETKKVTFDFCADDFYYWIQTSRKYSVQAGNYTFRVGGSSDNLPLTKSVTFKSGSEKPDLRVTRIYTMPRYPLEGQKVSFYALVKNQGNAATKSTTPYNISFSVAGKDVASTGQTKTVIAPGQVKLIASEGEWTAETAGQMQIAAKLAFSNESTEWDASNNSYATDIEVFDPQVVASEHKNLAFLKEVTVSSEVGKYIGKQLVDGDLSTRWDSENGTTASAVVDLAALCKVDKIELYWDADYAKGYVLEKSMDGTSWTELKKVSNSVGEAEYHSLEKFDTRYIRINFTERKTGAGKFSLREIRVLGTEEEKMPAAKVILPEKVVLLPHAKTYVDGTASTNTEDGELTYKWEQISGPVQASILSPDLPLTELHFNTAGTYVLRLTVSNGTNKAFSDFSITVTNPTTANDLALLKPTSASSSEKVNMYPQAAVDANANTRWSSAHRNGEWWQVDLQHQVKPSKISILWHSEYAKKFNIQISADGNTWNTYATNDSFGGGTSNSSNEGNVSGRYVRLNCVERSGQWENSIKTFNLYGDFVTNTNQVPVAKASYSANASGDVITLDAGKSSDADGDNLTYQWEQITGPAFVDVTDADKATATISNALKGSYYFKLTVDDGKDIDFTILHVVVDNDNTGITTTPINSEQLKVYPNPVRDELYIQYPQTEKLKRTDVYNVSGMLITSKEILNGRVSLKELAEGVYFLHVYSDNEKIGNVKVLRSFK
ncbi:glycoside hydrolase family 3 C-terminal domain-containing protein [Dysgonomonas sp. 520]|uniref:glycoside hydrolase family 3 C-terminal domain-containing protein n=1 Tax=Dysgonomonas sp. 520 TaxID=2302931 RepID=UPI0013D30C6E|nr:glycoside hydrolase family 3 C-terminal domain-containing protein [Dysgonomonas sp. 520]NDW10711.1 T9SS C-terminal target domain-containing protein [Dysgonomonas sp. 520]